MPAYCEECSTQMVGLEHRVDTLSYGRCHSCGKHAKLFSYVYKAENKLIITIQDIKDFLDKKLGTCNFLINEDVIKHQVIIKVRKDLTRTIKELKEMKEQLHNRIPVGCQIIWEELVQNNKYKFIRTRQ